MVRPDQRRQLDAKTDPDFVSWRATDALAVEGWSARSARSRLRGSRRRCVFPEAMTELFHVTGKSSEAVKVPVLANITSSAATARFFTLQELRRPGSRLLSILSFKRSAPMNAAALKVTMRSAEGGTQKSVVELMMTRAGLYETLDYLAYEAQASTIVRPRDKQNERGRSGPKAKKSVALSGVPAGNTALCTGRPQRQRLHYPRLDDILDSPTRPSSRKSPYLLVHGNCDRAGVRRGVTRAKLKGLRGLAAAVRFRARSRPSSGSPAAERDTRCRQPRIGCAEAGTARARPDRRRQARGNP